MTFPEFLALVWVVCGVAMVVLFVRAAREPLDDELAAIDQDLDEREAQARLYPSRRLIDVSPIACPVELEDRAA